jgi:hypothetical protein
MTDRESLSRGHRGAAGQPRRNIVTDAASDTTAINTAGLPGSPLARAGGSVTGVLVPEVKGRISELFWKVLSGRSAAPY